MAIGGRIVTDKVLRAQRNTSHEEKEIPPLWLRGWALEALTLREMSQGAV